jgi:16S rRNA (cytosine1402-N4)-methyltransferase
LLTEKFHKPVLLKEVLGLLQVRKGEKYLDATVGGGGHAEAILKTGGRLLAVDCDPAAVEAAGEHLAKACPGASWQLVRGNFKDLAKIAKKNGFERVAGVLFDLGVSTYQLRRPERGFSFNVEAPLDMRMDPSLGVTAADLINSLSKGDLDALFKEMADEKLARPIAHAIIGARRLKPITKTNQLAGLIAQVYKRKGKFPRIHPATRVFQALRMAVNSELDNLKEALPAAVKILRPGGRLVVISFHSGEDRMVKNFLKSQAEKEILTILTKKPIRPSFSEVAINPRSRSARLRAGEKV